MDERDAHVCTSVFKESLIVSEYGAVFSESPHPGILLGSSVKITSLWPGAADWGMRVRGGGRSLRTRTVGTDRLGVDLSRSHQEACNIAYSTDAFRTVGV